jgi:hypothetical protein
MAQIKNLFIDQATTYSDHIQFIDNNKQPISLVGYTVRGKMQKSHTSANASAIFALDIISNTTGNVRISLTAGDTANIPAGRYIYGIDAVSANVSANGDNVFRIAEGTVTVNPAAMASGLPIYGGSAVIYTTTAYVDSKFASLTTANVPEQGNLYFTNTRVYANVIGLLNSKANTTDLNTSNIIEGSNLYFTNTRVYANVIGLINVKANTTDLNTANVPEQGNLYFTNTRVYANVIGLINVKANTSDLNTANVVEGANLYFTNTRAVSALTSGQNINIAANGLVATNLNPNYNYIDFNSNTTFSSNIARVGWNKVDQTLDIGMDNGVVQQTGFEQYARVQNNTGNTIPNGTVVGFVGVIPDSALSVAPFLADGGTPSLYVLGIMTHNLEDNGAKGYCTTFGYVREVNTSAFNQGDILYASPTVSGGLTNIKPTAPYNVIPMAAVLNVGTTDGAIFVRPTIEQQKYFGGFAKTDSTTPELINTAYALTLTSTEFSRGISLGSPTSKVIIGQSGLYNVSISVQITSTNSASKTVRVWLRKNGNINLANSTRLSTININNGYSSISISDVYTFLANEYIEVMYATSDTGISISSIAATAYSPTAPAVVLALEQTSQ